jgi:predicted ATP-grasp superfamily ATP-dependent carboligase
MQVFLYEFVTGGGWYSYGNEPCPGSLLREGRAIIEALAADFTAIDDVHVSILQDLHATPLAVLNAEVVSVETRFQELAAFKRFAADADWTLVIAPEISGFLAQRAAIVEKLGGRLLGPSLEIIRLTSDKHALAESLAQQGIKTPMGIEIERGAPLPEDFPFPAVLKPRDGAGSWGVQMLERAEDAAQVAEPSRLEVYCAGKAVSVSFLCGPDGNIPLVPCEQRLSDDGRLSYLGGSLPLTDDLAGRAIAIASRAVETLGPTHGYLGVDLVLGDSPSGDDDVVIEINPRMTTSYVGLRAATEANLAEAMLHVASARDVSITWLDRAVQFEAAGGITI